MTSRLFPRAGLVAAAALSLVLTGCTPAASGDDVAAPASAGAPSSGAAAPVVSRPSSTLEAGDPATVVRVVDGDTIEVRLNGDDVTVRLLNIDTPETKHPSKAVQCLGPEATDLLESLLEPGDDVVLRYDKERTDRHGRTLAGVFEDEVLLNAEIARRGLGVPVVFEPNRRFYPEVLAAWNEAEADGAGLHQPDLECSLPVLAAPAVPGEEPPASTVEELTAVLEAVAAGEQTWMEVHYKDVLPGVERVVADHERRAEQAAAEAAERRRAEAQRAEQEAAERAEAEEEAARQAAAEREAAREAEAQAQREAERQAALEAEREAEEQAQAQAEARAAEEAAAEEEAETTALGWADTSSGSSSNKAPNRCYAPGGESYEYCDDQGSGSGSGSSDSGGGSGVGGPVAGSDGVCPEGYPVKVSSNNKYHLPGGRWYDNTGSKRCYASAAAAEAAGAVAAKG